MPWFADSSGKALVAQARVGEQCRNVSKQVPESILTAPRRRRLGLSLCFKNAKRTWEMRYQGFSPTTTQPVFLCASACAASVHVVVLLLRNCVCRAAPGALSTDSVRVALLAGAFGQKVVMSCLPLPDPVARFTSLRLYMLSVFL